MNGGGVRTVLAVAGGSGGHRYPAEAFLTALKALRPQWRLGLVVDRRALDFSESDFALHPIASWNPGGWRGWVSPARWMDFGRAFGDASSLLSAMNPDLLVGFGSYASVPPLLLGAWRKKPVMIHEQNAIWGVANGLLRHVADRAAVAIPAASVLKGRNTAAVGMPLRSRLEKGDSSEARRALGLDPAKRTLLVTGGSQGSLAINRVFDVFARSDAARGGGWQFVHLCGKKAELPPPPPPPGVLRIAFLKEMHWAYSAADAVLSRAGASSLHEIAFYAKPMLLVPYPFARAHQVANARFVESRGGAQVVLEKDFGPEVLAGWLKEFERDPQKMRRMGECAAAALNPAGAVRLAELAVQMVENSSQRER